jgi:hypothetical protein
MKCRNFLPSMHVENFFSDMNFPSETLRTERMIGPKISVTKKKAVSNENNERCPADKVPGGLSDPSIVVLETHPEVRKAVTRKCSDGQVLSLNAVSDKIVEKMMTCKVSFVCEEPKKQKEEGAKVSFEHGEKNGLEVNLTHFGGFLVGKMFVLLAAKLVNKTIIPDDWREESDNQVAFPVVNMRTLAMKEGCSADETENEHMHVIVQEEIILFLANWESVENVVAEEEEAGAGTEDDNKADIVCEFCEETPCAWSTERENVIATVDADHGDDTSLSNSSRRKSGSCCIWRVRNGVGQKGHRTRHPECAESGIRTLFPDCVFMGFKEEQRGFTSRCNRKKSEDGFLLAKNMIRFKKTNGGFEKIKARTQCDNADVENAHEHK